jgi:hypothetical protein
MEKINIPISLPSMGMEEWEALKNFPLKILTK